jgi:hypothetical protein
MEERRKEALECARRCVEALASTDDFETRLALWKAAKRYNSRDKVERTAGVTFSRPLLRAGIKGSQSLAQTETW